VVSVESVAAPDATADSGSVPDGGDSAVASTASVDELLLSAGGSVATDSVVEAGSEFGGLVASATLNVASTVARTTAATALNRCTARLSIEGRQMVSGMT
jgi:hypothetical protein